MCDKYGRNWRDGRRKKGGEGRRGRPVLNLLLHIRVKLFVTYWRREGLTRLVLNPLLHIGGRECIRGKEGGRVLGEGGRDSPD